MFQPMRNNFFLRRHEPLPSTIQLLRDLYPNVNWNRVEFYEGLPWFTPAVAPYVTCQALPQFYSFSKFRIYIKKFDEGRARCLADIVHEAFHVMQAMHFARGYGFGFFRIWMLYYVAVFMKHGYRQNPFEVPAYDQEFRFMSWCEKNRVHGIVPAVHPDSPILVHAKNETPLVFKEYKFRYQDSWIFLPLSFLFCLFISLVRPAADLVVYVIRIFVRPVKTPQGL
jgi:hypothetical protein